MTERIEKEFTPDMVGKIVDVGAYSIEDDSWFGSTAGVLKGYSSSPDVVQWEFVDSRTEPDYARKENFYILITVVENDD